MLPVETIYPNLTSKKNITIEVPLNVNWMDEASVQSYIAQFDIGVFPMIDHPFNRAKSAFKLKQYLSCGVPALVSPVGESNTFLKDRQNGFFCATVNEFKEKIMRFHNMQENEYQRMSNAAADSIINFDLDNFCEKLLSHFI